MTFERFFWLECLSGWELVDVKTWFKNLNHMYLSVPPSQHKTASVKMGGIVWVNLYVLEQLLVDIRLPCESGGKCPL